VPPGGGQRAIFFDTANEPVGFDANQAEVRRRRRSERDAIPIST